MIKILLIAPFLSSELICRRESSVTERYTCGLIAVWALFELTAVPFILLSSSFAVLCTVYDVLLVILISAGAVKTVLRIRKERKDISSGEKKAAGVRIKAFLPWLPVIILIICQCFFLIRYQHYDGDDSYYVAQSTISLQTDTMFRKDTNNGYGIDVEGRHALGALPVWIAWLSKESGLHPAVCAHSCMAPFLLLIMYGVYAMLSERLFKDKKYRPFFVLLMMLWYIHSNVSLYTAETFAYTRTWQGKAVFANIIVPLAFCFIADIYSGKKKTLLPAFLVSICGIFCTGTAVYMLTVLYGCAGLCLCIAAYVRTKKLKSAFITLLPFIIAVIPLLAGGVTYLLIR